MKTQEISAIQITNSGIGRDVTQRVSVVAMLLLGSMLTFLMKQMNIVLKYEFMEARNLILPMMTFQLACWIYNICACSDTQDARYELTVINCMQCLKLQCYYPFFPLKNDDSINLYHALACALRSMH